LSFLRVGFVLPRPEPVAFGVEADRQVTELPDLGPGKDDLAAELEQSFQAGLDRVHINMVGDAVADSFYFPMPPPRDGLPCSSKVDIPKYLIGPGMRSNLQPKSFP